MFKWRQTKRGDFGREYTEAFRNCLPYGVRCVDEKTKQYELFNREHKAITMPFFSNIDFEKLDKYRSKYCKKNNAIINIYSDGSKPVIDDKCWNNYEKAIKAISKYKCSYHLNAFSTSSVSTSKDIAAFEKKTQLDEYRENEEIFNTTKQHSGHILDLMPFGIREINKEKHIFEVFDRHGRAISTPMKLLEFTSKIDELDYLKEARVYLERNRPRWFYCVNKTPKENATYWDKYALILKKLVRLNVEFDYGEHSFFLDEK